MKETMNHTRQLAFAGLFAAILAVLSILQIPMPSGVPITLQTFAVALCGCVLGKKWGVISTLLYILLGTIGLPVFSGMKGGFGVLMGPTGGFLFGFLFLAAFCGWGAECQKRGSNWLGGGIGLVICHILGTSQFSLVSGRTFGQSLLFVSVPYVIKDILLVVGAILVGMSIRRALLAANLTENAK